MSPAAASCLAGGLWLGCLLPGRWPLAVLAVAVLLIAHRVGRDRVRLCLAVGACVLLGSGISGARAELAANARLVAVAERGGVVQVTGEVVSEARALPDGAWQLVRVRELDGTPVRERAVITVPSPTEAEPLGAQIGVEVTARPLGHEGFDRHLRGLHAVVRLDPVGPVELRAPPPWPWRLTTDVRERLRAAAWRGLPATHAPILTGLVTGDVTGQDPRQAQVLRDAGLVHLVVVSGKHVALVLAAVLGLALATGAGVRARTVVALVALGWFVLLVRWQPSVLRAGLMAAVVLGARVSGRRTDARHALAMVVVLLLLLDPFLAGQLGFALSVSATAGVLVIGPAVLARLRGPRPLRWVVAASVGAQVAVAPILLHLDGAVGAGAVPANLLAVPAATVAQGVGLLAAVVAQASEAAGAVVARVAHPPVGVIVWAAETFAGAPRITVAWLLSPSILVLGVAVVLRRRHPGVAAAGVVVAVALVLLTRFAPPAAVTGMEVTALDVGQGDAILVQVPGRDGPARMLVDGGPDPGGALAELRELRIRSLDLVVLSHPDADHADGLPAVLESLAVGALVTGPPLPDEVTTASARTLEEVASRRGVPVARVTDGWRLRLGEVPVEVLGPPADGRLDHDANASSVVLRVGSQEGVLLTGDVEELGQAYLLQEPQRLRAAVLKVPHHGGNTNAAGFLEAIGARDAVISVGADNTYGHPHPDVLAELGAMAVHRTDIDGRVSVRPRGIVAPDDAADGQGEPARARPDVLRVRAGPRHRRLLRPPRGGVRPVVRGHRALRRSGPPGLARGGGPAGVSGRGARGAHDPGRGLRQRIPHPAPGRVGARP